MSYLILVVGSSAAAFAFGVAWLLSRVDRSESIKSAARTKRMRDAVRGHASLHDDWVPDARIKGGMVYNKSKRRLEICGRLSEDSLERIYR